jgi:MoaA/NifB/PqqE/SkfB family radical SAM enzyme
MNEVKIPEASKIPLKYARLLKGPHQIAFDITDKCNFRCLHCFNQSVNNLSVNNELSDQEVIEFINDVSKMHPMNFCFCGGEPLLRVNLIYQAAQILASKGIMVSLVTNGSLVTEERAKNLISSGVSKVQVSLDGARPETHEHLRQYKKAFKYAINAISYFREVGYKNISVGFVPTSFNWHEIETTYRLCSELGVTHFRIQPLMILGRARIRSKDLIPNQIQYREIVRVIKRLQTERNGIAIELEDPVDHLIRFRKSGMHCVSFANVKANGAIEVSLYLPLSVGNIRRHHFHEYWEAGLARIWEVPKVKELASRIISINDFIMREKEVPIVWFEKDIELDLIDNCLLKEE